MYRDRNQKEMSSQETGITAEQVGSETGRISGTGGFRDQKNKFTSWVQRAGVQLEQISSEETRWTAVTAGSCGVRDQTKQLKQLDLETKNSWNKWAKRP